VSASSRADSRDQVMVDGERVNSMCSRASGLELNPVRGFERGDYGGCVCTAPIIGLKVTRVAPMSVPTLVGIA